MKRGTLDHPKVYSLCEILNIRRPTAIGYLEMLWHFTARYAPRGDIGRYTDKRIAAALDWHYHDPAKLIQGLISARWVDSHPVARLLVHDWQDHADDYVRKKLKRDGESFISVREFLTGKDPDNVRHLMPDKNRPALALPEPVPEPSLAARPPSPLPCTTEWPLTSAAIRKHDPAVDEIFVLKLANATAQFLISRDDMEPFDDQDLSRAVEKSYETHRGKNGHGTGLLLARVPQILHNWGKDGTN